MELYDKQFRCMEVNPGVPGFQRQVFKHAKLLSERSKEIKEQKKNRESVLVAESAYIAQNAQFGLVMTIVLPFVSCLNYDSHYCAA